MKGRLSGATRALMYGFIGMVILVCLPGPYFISIMLSGLVLTHLALDM